MDDRTLVTGFVRSGLRHGGQGRLKVETDTLVLDGWWPVAFRVAAAVFALRVDDPPEATTAVDDVAAELRALGLVPVGTDPPLLHVITLSEIAWGLVSWTVWARDPAAAETELSARAAAEPLLAPGPGDLPF